MSVISLMVVESILFTVLLIAISIVIRDKSISKSDEGLSRFLLFAYAYMIGIISYIVIYFINDSRSIITYILILVVWYSYCAVLASMIIQSMFLFDNNNRTIRIITEILCYYSLFVVMVELLFQNFVFDSNMTGIEFTPGVIPTAIYYAFPILIYYVCMGFLLWNYHKTHIKIREKHLMKLALGAIVPSFIGLIAETVCHTIFGIRYPVFFVMMIFSLRIMSDLHIKSRSFKLMPEDFESILKADNTDAVFICDDEQVIIYQNRAAKINSQMYRDTFIGRRITDVFVLDNDVKRAMKSKEARDGLMVPAIYPITERKVVMSVEYIYDCVDEILCSIITIPNYDISVDENSFALNHVYDNAERDEASDAKIPSVIEKDDGLTSIQEKANVDKDVNILLVDEDDESMDQYEELLKIYDIKISRALGGRVAIDMLLDPCYDAIFISYDMEKLNGIETAKRIRSMGKEYYSEVPIIFILNGSVADVYKDLLDVSFNDFIEKPLSAKKVNSIVTRWLWRRYAVTEKVGGGLASTRAVRSANALFDMYGDCIEFLDNGKINYIGYTLKGMKRLCSKLEDRKLIEACDDMTDMYIRGQYGQMPQMLEKFKTELERVRSSSAFGMIF